MVQRKKNSPLFEIIRSQQDSEDRLKVPTWCSTNPDSADHPRKFSWKHKVATFLASPWGLQMPTGGWAILAVVMLCAVITAYIFGRQGAPEISQSLQAIRNQPVNNNLLKSIQTNHTASANGIDGQLSPHPINGDPRTPGLNYYVLETMGERFRPYAERAVAFLKRNSVDAAVISVENGKIQVVALRGFEKTSSTQARRFTTLLRALGRSWKADHKGWRNWHDLYAAKYLPKNTN